jgi:hypothetical protein
MPGAPKKKKKQSSAEQKAGLAKKAKRDAARAAQASGPDATEKYEPAAAEKLAPAAKKQNLAEVMRNAFVYFFAAKEKACDNGGVPLVYGDFSSFRTHIIQEVDGNFTMSEIAKNLVAEIGSASELGVPGGAAEADAVEAAGRSVLGVSAQEIEAHRLTAPSIQRIKAVFEGGTASVNDAQAAGFTARQQRMWARNGCQTTVRESKTRWKLQAEQMYQPGSQFTFRDAGAYKIIETSAKRGVKPSTVHATVLSDSATITKELLRFSTDFAPYFPMLLTQEIIEEDIYPWLDSFLQVLNQRFTGLNAPYQKARETANKALREQGSFDPSKLKPLKKNWEQFKKARASFAKAYQDFRCQVNVAAALNSTMIELYSTGEFHKEGAGLLPAFKAEGACDSDAMTLVIMSIMRITDSIEAKQKSSAEAVGLAQQPGIASSSLSVPSAAFSPTESVDKKARESFKPSLD